MTGSVTRKEDVVGLFGERGALAPTAANVERAVRFVTVYQLADLNYDVHFALLTAFESLTADTIYLVNRGQLKGCRYLLPEAVVADFGRRNRFRRLVVHAIRICDTGPESQALMKGLAERSGGAYVWARKPPPAR